MPARVAAWLSTPVSRRRCILAWCLATCLFVAIAQAEGATTINSIQVDGPALAMAHGEWSCGFAASATPPMYQLLDAGVAAVTRPGAGVPFPKCSPRTTQAQMLQAVSVWDLSRTRAYQTLHFVAFAAWLVLLAGFVQLLRSAGKGRSRLEAIGVLLLGIAPEVVYCVTQSFHPEELLSLGLVLCAFAAVFRARWAWGGLLLGFAITAHLVGILAVPVLLVVAPKRARWSVAGLTAAGIAVVCVPVLVLSHGTALDEMLTNGVTDERSTWLVAMHLPHSVLTAIARGAPVALSLVLALVVRRKVGDAIATPWVAVSLLAAAAMLRIFFDIALYGYYLAWATVALLCLDLLRGRLRFLVLAWIAESAALYRRMPNSYHLSWTQVALQLLVTVTGLLLVAGPLREILDGTPSPGAEPRPSAETANAPA
jgi:hypothetical protein